jgi:hypothetical protein
MSDMMGTSTQVSNPSLPIGGTGPVGASAAPGALGPGGQMGIVPAVLWTIGGAGAALVVLGMIFRKGQKLPPLRVDAINAMNIYFSWLLVNGTVKIIAYRYHGHKLAQAYLLVA